MQRFEGRVALLSGAASGVGRACAERFASEGARVFGVDVDESGLQETAKSVEAAGGTMHIGRFDLSRRDGCHAAVQAAVDTLGQLDVLGNIAGVNQFHVFTEMTEEQWDFIQGVNLKGVAFMAQAALPHLIETKGAIVNVASVAGLIGQAYTVAYCASKGGVVQLTRALAMEYINQGVRINAVAPGGINTAMNSKIEFPEAMDWKLIEPYRGRRGSCEASEVAAAIAFLASEEARFVHGEILSIDGGVHAGG
jgi:NAD(P)-dependent dehydrogenase (short-subunit alcohol dehydrogenase family)